MVEYCPVCTLPPEYCQYTVCSRRQADSEHSGTEEAKETNAEKPDKKKESKKAVVIKSMKRKNKKVGLTISGLEHFGLDNKKMTKTFAGKFACGGSVLKDPTNTDVVFVQADVFEEVRRHLVVECKVPEGKISIIKK
ncbi:MAG: translation machinery-associated protein 22 [Amphiamblys sp. WSBS2006]|nr:MAG: translation machinery-associated protein 22 [Amphiamblys sp. WSBS2006]